MIVCSKCKKRIAKRTCPALGSPICHLCCGRLREKELHCPSSCIHLSRHKNYQEKRLLEKKSPAAWRNPYADDDIMKDERLAWLIVQLEAPLYLFAERLKSLSDRDVVLALEYAKDKLQKGQRRIVLPGENLVPKNDLGEAVLQASENARWQGGAILFPGHEIYKTEEKLRTLDRIIDSVKFLARSDGEGRAYLRNLAERFARIKGPSQKKEIITPT